MILPRDGESVSARRLIAQSQGGEMDIQIGLSPAAILFRIEYHPENLRVVGDRR
jgi:hypothetical protein